MVHSEFPLERLAQLASNPFQIGFARQVMRMLDPSDLIAYEAAQDGLLMRAQNEEALARPVALLRDLYGDDLVLLPPQVRYMSLGNRPYEPIMLLRVRIAPRHREAVLGELAERDVQLLEEHERPSVCVLRAEAPLRKLLGYGEALAKLTDGTGLHWIWLDRYIPMSDPPGGQAAEDKQAPSCGD
ncbi:MAG: hypothetical protein KJZ92_06325 [Rhodocyclaceae bacterium]|jgi:hypothetical protein|nr:hypothetical protein [Rhodocyclaceae bacterium]MCL4680872.1 hypothetical protein [Rhodocyclaceae bacterium]